MKAEERYIIEVSGKGAGILVGAHGAYVFHAALPEARSLATGKRGVLTQAVL